MNRFDEWVPISALEHYCYCPRQSALILVDGVWTDNEHTVRGERGHRRADTTSVRRERGRRVARAVPLWSEALGLTGRADAIEVSDDGTTCPVEYKMGRRHGDAADVQLCAEALCLEEMTGRSIKVGYVWYSATRKRHRVEFHDGLRRRTCEIIDAVHASMQARLLPAAVDDERCDHCQLAGHCLPDVVADTKWVATYLAAEVLACGS